LAFLGSKEQVTNILGHIAQQRETALTRGEKDRVTKKLYLMAAQNPDSSLWAVDKPPIVRVLDPMTNTVRTMVDPNYRNLPYVVILRIGGKDAAIRFAWRGEVWRVACAFDPKRQVILLAGGDKGGADQRRFYKRLIAMADDRYDDHLASLNEDCERSNHGKKTR